jgi:hypothetical protein
MSLEDVIRRSGEDWLIDEQGPRSEVLDRIRKTLAEVERLANERGMGRSVILNDKALIAESERNPANLKGLFQAIGAAASPEMLLMVWRVLQGMEIKDLSIAYQSQPGGFRMVVVLDSPYGEGEERYESSRAGDFRLLRHIGFLEVQGVPVLDGFYPLRLSVPTRSAK